MMIDNFSLRTKTLIPLGVMAMVILAMVAFGASNLTSVSQRSSDIIEHRDMAAFMLSRTSRNVVYAPYSIFGLLTYDNDSAEGQAAGAEYPKSIAAAEEGFDAAMKLAPDRAADIARFKDRFQAIVEMSKAPFQIGHDSPGLIYGSKLKPQELDKMAEGARLVGKLDTQVRALASDLVKFNDVLLAENAQAAADLRAQSSSALITMVIVGLVSILVAGAFALWMSSSKIAGPLVRLAERMRTLAQGDLTVVVEGQDRRDEIGDMSKAVQVFKANALEAVRLEAEVAEVRTRTEVEGARTAQERAAIAAEQAEVVRRLGEGLQAVAGGDLTVNLKEGFSAAYAQIKDDFNDAVCKLQETMIAVVSSTESIDSGTQEIASASGDLARRTEQQAASLEETAAALDEITATVKASAEGATHARQVVTEADTDAKKSSIVVRQAVDAMSAIAKSSHQISQIIGVIDEIAFQTNLLALNAGVEAARAGDAGRGFAVVASEVRALAQRSAEAAKEIKGLINSSATQVGQGVVLVEETGKSLDRIMAQVTQINEIVGEIAAGTKEQASALAEVNVAINQMDQTTQQNAAMVEQSTAASQSLSQETGRLAGLVGQFQVGRSNSDHAMRRELKRAAPHAFRQPAKPAAAAPTRQAAPARKVANGASVASTDESWKEF